MGALLLASQQFLKWLKERLQSSCNLPNILGGKLSLGFIGHAQSSSRRSRSRDIDRTSFRRNAFKRDSGFFTLISTGRGVWIRMEVPSHSHAMRATRSAVDSSPNSHSSTRPEAHGGNTHENAASVLFMDWIVVVDTGGRRWTRKGSVYLSDWTTRPANLRDRSSGRAGPAEQ